jgi:glycosyltransferase involved in cell wall biosynthesis
MLGVLAWGIRRDLRRGRSLLLVENCADRAWIEGRDRLSDEQCALMPGAGVELDRFTPALEPPASIVVGIAARLVWSKGIDIAVEAIRHLRADGFPIELRIAGGVDAGNPEHVSDSELARWREAPGVTVLGRVSDINAFWSAAHIACLPSRGGEGLPRALLEASARGRPIVTTATPGCAEFVISGETGLVVAPNDPAALADALRALAQDPAVRARMGAAGRARVERGYTIEHAADVASAAWRQLMAAPR